MIMRCKLAGTRPRVPPLPKGEGRGEGEGTGRLSSARESCNRLAGLRISDFGFVSDFRHPTHRAFTLIEVLLALGICAIVLVAMNAVFATAVRLRDKTTARVDEGLPINRALDLLRADLKGAVGPGGFMAGDFKCSAQTMGASMGLTGEAGGSGVDFITSTGILRDDAPWGDLQEVFYELKTPADRSQGPGMSLVRCVNRNLLAATTQTPEVESLMDNIESVQFDCFDGTQWRNTWDTSSGDTNLPVAVRIRVQMAAKPGEDAGKLKPLEMLVPLVTETRSLTNSTAGGTQ
jgi:type II secretion system protein J